MIFQKEWKKDMKKIFNRRKIKTKIKQINHLIANKPFTSFFTVLFAFLVLIVIGNLLLKPQETPQAISGVKTVQVYKIGSAPRLKVQAQVEKSGVVKIVAISPGVVDYINVFEGTSVDKGTNLISLSTNYSGGNVFAISAAIAGEQYNLAKKVYDDQKDLINKQKEIANKTSDNAKELRDISDKSAEDTKSLLDLNQSMLDQINANLDSYNATISGGLNSPVIFQTTQVKAQIQSAITQLRAQLRSLEYQADGDKPPAELADLQKEIALKQLDIQEKSLAVNLEVARLQYNLASINAASMYPSAPFNGVVDKIYVKVGQYVTGGTPLMSLSGVSQHIKAVAKVPRDIALNVSMIEPTILYINSTKIEVVPSYISQDATDGQLYSVIYQLDDSYQKYLTDTSYITINIPIGTGDTNNAVPFVPLDAVFQTQEEAYIFLVGKDNKAVSKKVELGQVQGKYVEVVSGIPPESTLILSRNVVEGDTIAVQQ